MGEESGDPRAGLEATTPASARTIVCVEESRVEMGHYDSGEPGYAPSWGTIFVRLSDRKVYFMGRSLDGEMPPQSEIQQRRGRGQTSNRNLCALDAAAVGAESRALQDAAEVEGI